MDSIRRWNFIPKVFFIPFVLLSQPCHAIKGINSNGSLDKPLISKSYFEGEFWTVINALEEYRKDGLKSASRDDSIYTFKYLSVVYAAEPATRPKAESFMYALLKMMPTIDLLDLYISDNIESVFQKVRNEYDRMQKLSKVEKTSTDLSAATTSKTPAGSTASEPKQAPPLVKENGTPSQPVGKTISSTNGPRVKPWVWFAIGGGTAAAAATYFVLSEASPKKSAGPEPTWDVQFTPSN